MKIYKWIVFSVMCIIALTNIGRILDEKERDLRISNFIALLVNIGIGIYIYLS